MRKYLFLILCGFMFSSCEAWLDVKPNDRISEDATFATERGFEMALNGVYIELNDDALYGQNLSYEFVEILAQRYDISGDANTWEQAMRFNYTSMAVESKIASIWETAYHLIANINLILKNCEERRDVLSDAYYNLIKGECLALRAYLHFDLFRLFGPVYSTANEVSGTIPYYKEFQLFVGESLPAAKFMSSVIDDLNEAATYLKDDPILTQGAQSVNDANSFYGWRTLRMNYYAVKLLQARVYLYMGNKEAALEAAKEVIGVQEEKFPWVEQSTILPNLDNPDRIFSTEVVFALQNSERNTIFTANFDSENLKRSSMLAPLDNVISYMFEGMTSDFRYMAYMNQTFNDGGSNYKAITKYKSMSTETLYNQMIPLMRVSEAYYIAAECETDETTAKNYINTVLNARNLSNMYSYQTVEGVLDLEYYREFWLEGQLFFYYKRKNYNEVYSATEAGGVVTVNNSNYVLPIPESETQYN